MPNWMNALSAATSPMVPRSAIQGLQEALSPGSSGEIEGGIGDIPDALRDLMGLGLEDIPEALGGFASGALEGARGMTSPLDAISLAAPGLLGMAGRGMRAAAPFADDAMRMGRQAFDLVDDAPVPQSMPSMGDVDAIIGDSRRMMAGVPNATGQMRRPGQGAMSGLQSARPRPPMPPEFVPRGGEEAFNAAQDQFAPALMRRR